MSADRLDGRLRAAFRGAHAAESDVHRRFGTTAWPSTRSTSRHLFGRLAAVIHHGGAGTTTTATRAGVPQVVVPQWADQPYFARRVAELGIGAAHDPQPPTTESLSAALATALAPQTRTRTTEVAGMISTDGTTVAANLLLGLAGPRRIPAGPDPKIID